MQRIVIKNFGAVKEADIELKKITVLIGEQASGKSTIAKLVYYFKTIRNLFLRKVLDNNAKKELFLADFMLLCEEEFYNLFGSTINLPNFEICYYFNKKKYIHLALDESKMLNVFFSDEMRMNEFIHFSNNTKRKSYTDLNIGKKTEELLSQEEEKNSVIDFFNLLNRIFESNQSDFLYIIAGRNATVSYSELFEKYLFAEVQYKLIENTKLSFSKKRYNVDEALMLKFMERIVELKSFFRESESFDSLLNYYPEMTIILNKIDKIVKGKYLIDESGEKIIYNNQKNNFVFLSNASSGQQEVIRILQDIIISIISESKLFRILEEPEAHLFPSAQKQLIELLSFLMNQNEDNQIIITTHSPYILTIFNNLIFSKRIIDKNPDATDEVNEVIQKEFWVDSDDFSAYNLGKTDDNERKAQSIVNEKTGLIQQNYLDEVSEKLGDDFQKLYSIHQKSFSRK
jgi:predicted ATPase